MTFNPEPSSIRTRSPTSADARRRRTRARDRRWRARPRHRDRLPAARRRPGRARAQNRAAAASTEPDGSAPRRVPDRRRRQRARGLPDRRLRQQHPGVLDRRVRERGDYRPAQTVLFTDGVDTGCGARPRRSGPFYCPADEHRLHRPRLLRRARRRGSARRAGRSPRPTSSPTSTATTSRTCSASSSRAAASTGATSRLRADGAPGRLLRRRLGEPRRSTRLLEPLTAGRRSRDALDAAAAVGDDRIQEETQGQVDPEPGRTARRPSASTGSRPASTRGRQALRHVQRRHLAARHESLSPRRRRRPIRYGAGRGPQPARTIRDV